MTNDSNNGINKTEILVQLATLRTEIRRGITGQIKTISSTQVALEQKMDDNYNKVRDQYTALDKKVALMSKSLQDIVNENKEEEKNRLSNRAIDRRGKWGIVLAILSSLCALGVALSSAVK